MTHREMVEMSRPTRAATSAVVITSTHDTMHHWCEMRNLSPETLRQRRDATATYAACGDIRVVQELMGHASPTTTAVYAAWSREVAHRAVSAAAALTG